MSRTPGARSRSSGTAWATAIGLLARRDLSEGEVRKRLLARDFAQAEIEEAIPRLRERRYLDDRSLATAVVRTQVQTKHRGPLRVKAYLRQRQIPEKLAEEAIRAEFPEGAENERAVIALGRIARPPSGPNAHHPGTGSADGKSADREGRKEAGRLFRRLVSLGYSWEAARHALLSDAGAQRRERDGEIEA